MKDPYIYSECVMCGNIFRTLKSGAGDCYTGLYTNEKIYFVDCPQCGFIWSKKTTRKEWKKSNEVKPDNV